MLFKYRLMPDYKEGKIYKIWDTTFSSCYVGSTCETLSKRMTRHRDKYKQYLQGRYPFITSFRLFNEFGCENCKIELLEPFPCNSRAELEAREGHHIRNTECVNRIQCGRTSKQYYLDTIDHHKKMGKEWREKNRELKIEQDTLYRQEHKEEIATKLKEQKRCECGCYVSLRNMATHKKSQKHDMVMQQMQSSASDPV